MKRFILLIIVLYAAFSSDFGAYAQTNQREDVIKKDSALFHYLAIDDTICPMINFQLAMQCYNFLKGSRYWETTRHGIHSRTSTAITSSLTDNMAYYLVESTYFL